MPGAIARVLRKKMARQEVRLWLRLRALRGRGFHFRRQAPFENYVLDFVSFRDKVVIELDGSQHNLPDHRVKDDARDARLAADGFQVLRFWNMDVDRNLDGVIETIWRVLEEGRLKRRGQSLPDDDSDDDAG